MDAKTAEIRYQRWVQVIQDWNNSGLSKRDYCQQNAIDENSFIITSVESVRSLQHRPSGQRCRKVVQQILWGSRAIVLRS